MYLPKLISDQLFPKLTVLAAILTFLFFPTTAFAQSQPQQKTPEEAINSILNSLFGCMVTGVSFIPEETCKDNPTNSTDPKDNKGALGFAFKGIALAFAPPLSSTEYLADVGSNLGIIKDANAQSVRGSGNSIVLPVRRLWSIMRNFSYLMFTFIFVFIGIMIMFRRKLNPQTVVSLQSALPGLIISLALITVSYLIAAGLVDLTFILIPIVAVVFQQAGDNVFMCTNSVFQGTAFACQGNGNLVEFTRHANFFSFLETWIKSQGIYAFVFPPAPPPTIDPFPSNPLDIPGYLTKFLSPWFQDFFGTLIKTILELLKHGVNLLVGIIVIIALLFQILKLFLILVRSYITILVMTFMGPMMILFSAIPGKGGALTFWWKNILANALIFPAVFAGFFFAGLILSPTGIDQNAFSSTLPFFADLPVNSFKYIIGLGILLGLPAVPQMVKDLVGVKDLKGIPEEAMNAFGRAASPFQKSLQKGMGQYAKDYNIEKEAQTKYAIQQRVDALAGPGGAMTRPRRPWAVNVGRFADFLGVKT